MESRLIRPRMLFIDTSSPADLPVAVYRVLRRTPESVVVIRLPDDEEEGEEAGRRKRRERRYPEIWEHERLAEGLASGLYVVTDVDPHVCLRREEDLTPAERTHRDAGWKMVKDLLMDEDLLDRTTRNKAILRTIEKLAGEGIHTTGSHIRDLLFLCWHRAGGAMSLVPDYSRCGKTPTRATPETGKRGARRQPPPDFTDVTEVPQGIVIDDGLRELMYRSGIRHYENHNPMRRARSLRQAYERMLATHFRVGKTLLRGNLVPVLAPPESRPSFDQFLWAYRHHRSKGDIIRNRRGPAYYYQHHRERIGSTREMAIGPGSLYQTDPTNCPLYLRSSLFPKLIIGRPTLYLIRDHFSHMFTGYALSLEAPGWVACMMALENACSDKVEHCRKYGIEISRDEWPCDGSPGEYLADRGELWSDKVEPMIGRLDTAVNNTATRRPELKGLVESGLFLVEQNAFTGVPGAVDRNRDRGAPDPVRHAALFMESVHKIIIEVILESNHEQDLGDYVPDPRLARDGVPRRPIDYWNWGIENCTGVLHHVSREELRHHLMPPAEAAVTEDGISFRGLFYFSETGRREGWFERGLRRGGKKVTISYDPRDMSRVFLRLDGGRVIEECRLVESQHHLLGATLDEAVAYLRNVRHMSRQQSVDRTDSKVKLTSRIDAAVAESKQRLTAEGISVPAQGSPGIRANAEQELRHERARDAWTATGAPATPAAAAPSELPPSHNDLLLKLMETDD